MGNTTESLPPFQTLLSGSLRHALDPLGEGFSDQAMFAALRSVHLLPQTASELEVPGTPHTPHSTVFHSLDSVVSERGEVSLRQGL